VRHLLAASAVDNGGVGLASCAVRFDLVATANPKLTTRFYKILFERYPQTQAMFPVNNRARQAEMLTGALVAALDHLEDAPWLGETLAALGAKHVGYGVTREMYDWVGGCLLAALAEAAGPKWTRELDAAWSEAYGAVASLMLARTAAGPLLHLTHDAGSPRTQMPRHEDATAPGSMGPSLR
jgi:hemoglobin-like flavoprotein